MKKLLKSNLIMVTAGSLLYLAVTFGTIMSSVETFRPKYSPPKDPNHIEPVLEGPSWVYVNPDLDELILELQIRKEKIKSKEEELKLWELQIQKELESLRGITNRVQSLRADLELSTDTLKDTEADNIRRLLDLFKTLQPSQTASILEPMSDAKIAKIFRLLKPSEVGPIVQLWLSQGGHAEERVHKILQKYQGIVPEKDLPETLNNS